MSENYCPTCGPRRIYARTLAFYPDGPDLNRNTCLQCGRTLVSADATEKTKDAEIAALTEKLRIVEAERDEAHATIRARSAAHSQVADENGRLGAQLSTLRAELERKDAALKAIAESDEWSGGLSNTSHQERARAALQPKEPPCQKA